MQINLTQFNPALFCRYVLKIEGARMSESIQHHSTIEQERNVWQQAKVEVQKSVRTQLNGDGHCFRGRGILLIT